MIGKYILLVVIHMMFLNKTFACTDIAGHYQFFGKIKSGPFPFKRLPSFDIDGLRQDISSYNVSSFQLIMDDTGSTDIYFYNDIGEKVVSKSLKLLCVDAVWTWRFTAKGASSEGPKIEIDMDYSYFPDENKNLLVQKNGVINSKYYSNTLLFNLKK